MVNTVPLIYIFMALLEHSVNKAITNFTMVNHIRFKIFSILISVECILNSALPVFWLITGVLFVLFSVFALSGKLVNQERQM